MYFKFDNWYCLNEFMTGAGGVLLTTQNNLFQAILSLFITAEPVITC